MIFLASQTDISAGNQNHLPPDKDTLLFTVVTSAGGYLSLVRAITAEWLLSQYLILQRLRITHMILLTVLRTVFTDNQWWECPPKISSEIHNRLIRMIVILVNDHTQGAKDYCSLNQSSRHIHPTAIVVTWSVIHSLSARWLSCC